MRFGQWIIVLVLIGTCALASAEFYRYIDEEGRTCYTDNLANVPVDQRPKHEYGEPDDQLTPEEGAERKRHETECPEGPLKEAEEMRIQKAVSAKEGEENSLGQTLKETRAKLEEEYQALMKEKEELEKIATTLLTPAAYTEYNEKVMAHNARVKDYEKRQQAFNKEVERYDASREKEEALEERQKEVEAKLQEEYQGLMKEKEELEKAATKRLTWSGRRRLKEKVREYNARIKDYEKRRKAFEKEGKSYDEN